MGRTRVFGVNEVSFIGVGAAAAVLVLLVLQAATSSGTFGTTSSTVTLVATSTLAPKVNEAFYSHLFNVTSGNESSIMSAYESNAILVVEGANANYSSVGGLAGSYSGSTKLSLFFTKGFIPFFREANNMTISSASYEENTTGALSMVNSTLNVTGFGIYTLGIRATVSVQIEYQLQGNVWLISSETWNFTAYAPEFAINST